MDIAETDFQPLHRKAKELVNNPADEENFYKSYSYFSTKKSARKKKQPQLVLPLWFRSARVQRELTISHQEAGMAIGVPRYLGFLPSQ